MNPTRIISDTHIRHGFVNEAAADFVRETPDGWTVVLNGDIWDFCRWPWADRPPTPEQFVGCSPAFAAALRDTAARAEVVLVAGNHDQGLTQRVLDRGLYGEEGEAPARKPKVVGLHRDGPLLVLHGHQDAMFCKDDTVADPARARSLGWWATRAATTAGLPDCVGISAVREVLEEAWEAFAGHDTLGQAVVDALRDLAAAGPDDFIPEADGRDMPWADLRSMYGAIWNRWLGSVGPVRAAEALVADLGLPRGLFPAMRRRAKSFAARIVVTGHTHAAGLDTSRDGAVLVNSGAFGPHGLADSVVIESRAGVANVSLCSGGLLRERASTTF